MSVGLLGPLRLTWTSLPYLRIPPGHPQAVFERWFLKEGAWALLGRFTVLVVLGCATVWQIWGAPQAINAGDAMFTFAHLAVQKATNLSAEIRLRALQILDETLIDLTTGQYLDMKFETRVVMPLADYITMINGKTAALIAAATAMGALVSDQQAGGLQAFRDFGRYLGLAFQVRDDILGIWGEAHLTGKSVSSDIQTRKKTYPILYALEQYPDFQILYQFDDHGGGSVEEIVAYLDQTPVRAMAEKVETEYSDQALKCLAKASPFGDAGLALEELTKKLLGRVS